MPGGGDEIKLISYDQTRVPGGGVGGGGVSLSSDFNIIDQLRL